MPQRLPEVEFESRFEKDEDERQRSETVRDSPEPSRIDDVEERAEQHARGHQYEDVGNPRPQHQAIGDEGQDQKPSEQPEKGSQVHRMRPARCYPVLL